MEKVIEKKKKKWLACRSGLGGSRVGDGEGDGDGVRGSEQGVEGGSEGGEEGGVLAVPESAVVFYDGESILQGHDGGVQGELQLLAARLQHAGAARLPPRHPARRRQSQQPLQRRQR